MQRFIFSLGCSLFLFSAFELNANAQPATRLQPGGGQPQKTSETDEIIKVVIKRDAIQLMNPKDFQAPISLLPGKVLEIRAMMNGIIQNVRVKPGEKVKAQQELAQIDSERTRLLLERAKANLQATNLRTEFLAKSVSSGEQSQVALDLAKAEAKLAETELKLAQYNLEQTSIRAAFSGQVQLVNVVQGTQVDKGDLLLKLVDTSELVVHVPVNREKVKQGEKIEIQLDNKKATGTVQAILPLGEKWKALRQIVDTAAVAVIVLSNPSGEYQEGQTVYSSVVPRYFVIEVPNLSLKNSETGTRIIQVVRDSMIRDIEVQLLGPVGEGRSYVSGPVQEKDELIKESSQSLADGTFIQPSTLIEESAEKVKKRGAGITPGASSF